MDTERIEGEGWWWEVRTMVTRGMRKRFRHAGFKGLAGVLAGNGAAAVDLEDPEQLRRAALAHLDAWDQDAVDDAYLLHGTVAWSWAEAVSAEAIEARPDAVTERVLARLRELYAESTEEQAKA